MLSNKCKYAIRAVLYLASVNKSQPMVGGVQVAEYLMMPQAFTVKILQELARFGVISSAKGPGGGFYLTENNLKLPVLRIVECMDGLDVFHRCGLGLSECSNEHPCPLHETFSQFRDDLHRSFLNLSVEKLSADVNQHQYRLTVK